MIFGEFEAHRGRQGEYGDWSPVTVHRADSPRKISDARLLIRRILYKGNPVPYDLYEQHMRYVIACRFNSCQSDHPHIIGAGMIALNPHLAMPLGQQLLAVLERDHGIPTQESIPLLARFCGTAVDPDHRKEKTGSQLFEERRNIALEQGKTIFFTQARESSWPIFVNRGFIQYGQEESVGDGETPVFRKWFYKVER